MATIVFDFDGTLHDSMYIYSRAFARGYDYLVEQGVAEARTFANSEIANNIGLTAEEAWTTLCPQIPWSESSKAAVVVGQAMDELIWDGTARLFPGVEQMLAEVHDAGHQLIFLSNCRIAYQEAARKTFGFDRFFAGYYNSEQFGGIPKEQIFETIASDFEGPYIVVGDRDKDLAIAHTHGLPSIGCLYGYATKPGELDDATVKVEKPEDIAAAIEQLA